ncbi:MAG: hypothetical protein HC925_07155 [Coleofasciculaceae cyanobacterium SM2_3_26]|nr:hypothetical protein [Coleofasciculaceae cyanobacterium SM2_3_26]
MAYLLVAHGSRDRRYGAAFDELAARVRSRLIAAKSLTHSQPIPAIGIATLECSAIPLHQQIERFALEIVGEEGDRPLHLLPLFLLPGAMLWKTFPPR